MHGLNATLFVSRFQAHHDGRNPEMWFQLVGDLHVPLKLRPWVTTHVHMHFRGRLPESDLQIVQN